MKLNISQYSIHGLVNIKAMSPNPKHIECLNSKYGFFAVDELNRVDIEVVVAPVKFPKKAGVIKKGRYHIGGDSIFWKNSRKLARWEVYLKGLENGRTEILFWGNSISLKYLFMHILEPLINIKLAARGFVLMHASGIGTAEEVYVFCSLPGAGKTSLAMYLVEKAKSGFLSDEFVILSRESEVFNFMLPVAFYDYNVSGMSMQLRSLGINTVVLNVKKLIRQLTNNRIKIPSYVDVSSLYPDVEIIKRGVMKRIYILNNSTAEKPVLERLNIDKAVDDIMRINCYQFRFLYEALDAYLSETPQSGLRTIYTTQREILYDSLQSKDFLKLHIPDVAALSETDIVSLLA